MEKKLIKTIYIEEKNYKNEKILVKIDIYGTKYHYFRVYTYINGETTESRSDRFDKYFEYSSLKEHLETEFNQALCDEFQRQSKEYKKNFK